MSKLITAKNVEFVIMWIGVSTLDGSLRFAIPDGDLDDIHNTFKDPEQTTVLTEVIGESRKDYSGFTDYRGFDKKFDSSVVVALNRGGIT